MKRATSSIRTRCACVSCSWHKREIVNLFSKTKQDGYSVIPLAVYFKSSRVKVEIGLCKGKKLHDKRDSIAARDAKREMDRAMKERNR